MSVQALEKNIKNESLTHEHFAAFGLKGGGREGGKGRGVQLM